MKKIEKLDFSKSDEATKIYVKRLNEIPIDWKDVHPNIKQYIGYLKVMILKAYPRLKFDNEIATSSGGKTSKRKTDTKILDSANKVISEIRAEKNYKKINLSETHTQKRLFDEMQKRGFIGTLSWVKKYWHTITKLS
ncbi:MAG: hypothetical protein JNM78_07205 [Cyclobacteriaceae bacterium]|nr:hypothetical protein [Cyclobacteriaceae bacterium]